MILASWYRSPKHPTRGSFIREQALALAQRGIEVHVVSIDRERPRRPLSIVQKQDGLLTEHSIAAIWPLHRIYGFYWSRPLASRLERIIADAGPDVIHAHAVRPAGHLATIASHQIPIVITEHSASLPRFWHTEHGRRQIERAYLAAKRCLAVSGPCLAEINRLFPVAQDQWQVLHNGVDTSVFRPDGTKSGEADVLYVGSLTLRKNVDLLLHTLLRLDPRVTASIVGVGPEKRALRRTVAELGLSERVKFLGPASRDRVAELMRGHRLLALPSNAETFGLVCAEALACGIPVVATRCGGPEDIVPSFGGRLVPVGDVTSFASAVDAVLNGLPAYSPTRLSKHIRDGFSMTKLAQKLHDLYLELTA